MIYIYIYMFIILLLLSSSLSASSAPRSSSQLWPDYPFNMADKVCDTERTTIDICCGWRSCGLSASSCSCTAFHRSHTWTSSLRCVSSCVPRSRTSPEILSGRICSGICMWSCASARGSPNSDGRKIFSDRLSKTAAWKSSWSSEKYEWSSFLTRYANAKHVHNEHRNTYVTKTREC